MSYSVTLVNVSVEKLSKALVDEILKRFKRTLKDGAPIEFCEWMLEYRLCQETIINELQVVCDRRLVWNRHSDKRIISVDYGIYYTYIEYCRGRGFFHGKHFYLSKAYV
jgi:hypothetical protein